MQIFPWIEFFEDLVKLRMMCKLDDSPNAKCKEWFYVSWKYVAVGKGCFSDNNICRKWSMEECNFKMLSFQVADVSLDEVLEDLVKCPHWV